MAEDGCRIHFLHVADVIAIAQHREERKGRMTRRTG